MPGVARLNKGRARVAGNIGTPIDLQRPIIKNEDRTFSTEDTITVGSDGKFFNIPTIIGGKRVSDKEAKGFFRKTGKNVGEFDSQKEAVEAAKRRSKRIGELRGK